METGVHTAERREMAAVNEGNRTLAADDIDWCVSQIHCLCEWHVVNFYPVIPNHRHCVVGSQSAHQVVLYSQSSVEIISSTSSVKES
jgi:hypothetical protein